MTTFNLFDIYTQWSSYKGLPFPANSQDYLLDEAGGSLPRTKYFDHYKSQFDFKTRFGIQAQKNEPTDITGRILIAPITLDKKVLGSLITDEGSKNVGHQYWLQPMIVIEGSKQIVKTPIVGGKYPGTIKEFINFGDYSIRIFGAVVSKDQRQYPQKEVTELMKLWEKNKALPFEYGGIYGENPLFDHVIIEKIKLDELKLAPGIQTYEISCVSDSVNEVELLKNDNADS